jgi:hypothetical protein
MNDGQPEAKSHDFAVKLMRGHVLVGGLGLGCIVERLQEKNEVTEILVIEKSQEVIDLVWRHLDAPKATIIQCDLERYLKTTRRRFDYIYMDVWPGRNDESIPKWRALAEQFVAPDKVLCWGEDRSRTWKTNDGGNP